MDKAQPEVVRLLRVIFTVNRYLTLTEAGKVGMPEAAV